MYNVKKEVKPFCIIRIQNGVASLKKQVGISGVLINLLTFILSAILLYNAVYLRKCIKFTLI